MKVKDNYYVKWNYYKYSIEFKETLEQILGNANVPYGTKEITVCTILDADGRVISVGNAYCNEKDTPNNNIGRKNSLSRALKVFKSKEIRAAFWEEYRTMTQIPRW